MTKVSRNDIYVRDEKGPAWFEDFLYSFSNNKQSSVRDILDAITNQKSKTIESVVQGYREQVGLDSIKPDNDIAIKESCKIESSASRKLSIRHATEENKSVVDIIKNDTNLQTSIDSMLEHSGGTKKIHSIIGFLRDKLGADLVSYTDNELNNYIIDRKKHYSNTSKENERPFDVGRVGLADDYDDDVADYALHDGAK